VKGAYRRVIEVLEYFKACPGTLKKLGIQTIIMGPNLDGILDLLEWAHRRGVSVYFMAIVAPLCAPYQDNWHIDSEYSFLWPQDIAKVNNQIDGIIRMKKAGADIGNSIAQLQAFKSYFRDPDEFVKRQKQCKMGDGMLKVGPTGEVSLCAEKGSLGSIRESPIQDIWFSQQAKHCRQAIATCKTNCPQLINCYFEE